MLTDFEIASVIELSVGGGGPETEPVGSAAGGRYGLVGMCVELGEVVRLQGRENRGDEDVLAL